MPLDGTLRTGKRAHFTLGVFWHHFKQNFKVLQNLLLDGETMEIVTDFIFLGCKITAHGDYSLEIKRCLLLERKTMTNLDSILKSTDITLPTNVPLVKAMVFPVAMYGCIKMDRQEC